MKFLIDLQHPAHLHFFRNLVIRLKEEGHEVLLTGRDKDILKQLSKDCGFQVTIFGNARKGLSNLGRELVYRQLRLYKIIRKFRPDAIMAIAGTYISIVGKLMRIPTYVFYDTEHATLSNLLAYPFATCIYVPKCYKNKIRWNHVRYDGYHELAYLHPKYYQPNPNVLKEIGIEPEERYSIVRFVGWGAAHDVGHKGLTIENKIAVVEELKKYGKVLISSESRLPERLEPYKLHINVSKIHHVMHYAALVFAESATMVSEAAVMGVPAVYINPLRLGYLEEQERDYKIVFNYVPARFEDAIDKAISILSNYDRSYWRYIGHKITNEKIDVTDMLYHIALEMPFCAKRAGLR